MINTLIPSIKIWRKLYNFIPPNWRYSGLGLVHFAHPVKFYTDCTIEIFASNK